MPSRPASRSSRAASGSRSGSASSGSSSSSGSDSDDAGSAAVLDSVTSLNSSLSTFEQAHIRPLVGPNGRSLRDTLAAVTDEVERAKLLVTLGYVIEDLVWIYLKTKGINPESHPVVPELQRIRTYFTKIQDAVNPPKRTMAVDRPAAARFIRSALASNGQRVEDRSGADDIGMQTRFNVLKHQEAILREPDSDGESSGEEVEQGLELIPPPPASGSGSGAGVAGRARSSAAKGKGKAKASVVGSGDGGSDAGLSSASSDVVVIDAGALEQAASAPASTGAKRPSPQAGSAVGGVGKSKRAKMDPFAGYDSAGGAGSPSSVGKAAKSTAGRKRSAKSRM